MYLQFCYYIQHDEQKHRAIMYISHRPGELAEDDWAGNLAQIMDSDASEIILP